MLQVAYGGKRYGGRNVFYLLLVVAVLGMLVATYRLIKNKKFPPFAGKQQQLYMGRFSQAHPELCPEHGAHLRLLVLVSSALANAKKREAVRLTWGHYAARSDIVIAFVLGTPTSKLHSQLAAEDALYRDMIFGNFTDSYLNISRKALPMLEWTATYCERVPRLLKIDDDAFLNVPWLLMFAAKQADKTIWGRMYNILPPYSSPTAKYFTSKGNFGWSGYPFFATGSTFLLTSDCVAPLLSAARKRPYIWLDDVFVTGKVAEEVGIRKVDVTEFYNWELPNSTCEIHRTITTLHVTYRRQFELWKKLFDRTKY